MFGLDEAIAGMSDGTSVLLVVLAGVLLGLRHATDPDHVVAVTTLMSSGRERDAGRLGAMWGLGHALTLFAFGVPIVLFNDFLPERVQQLAESAIALVIVALAIRLIVRWRRGQFHAHAHAHDEGSGRHVHLHSHRTGPVHGHAHRPGPRSPRTAFLIGLVHGMGGSAGVGVLILASVDSKGLALLSLSLLALFTAVSMWIVTSGWGRALASRGLRTRIGTVAPVLGSVSLAFGVWYGVAAWNGTWYPF